TLPISWPTWPAAAPTPISNPACSRGTSPRACCWCAKPAGASRTSAARPWASSTSPNPAAASWSPATSRSPTPCSRPSRPPATSLRSTDRRKYLPSVQRDVGAVFGAGVVGARADDLAVFALFDDVRAPAGGAGHHEQRGEHRRRDAHHVVGTRAVPVQVREHLLGIHHQRLDALADVEQRLVAAIGAQLARDLLDDRVARVADGVDRVAEADHDLLALHARADVGLGHVRRGVA